jgi:hypothetical protein
VVSKKLLTQFAMPAPLDPGAPFIPDVPLDPVLPLLPEVPEEPEDPEVPSPPLAPAKFTCQAEKVPEPTTVIGVPYVNTPVDGLYDITGTS